VTPSEPENAGARARRATAEQSADPRTELAVVRTELALDRTQLAWVRTTFALITAGFALDKITEALHQARMIAGTNWVRTGHLSGILLTVSATVFLVITSVEYVRQARRLARLKGSPPPWLPPVLLLSSLVVLVGAVLSGFLLAYE
jgi:inner membrane protein YidH